MTKEYRKDRPDADAPRTDLPGAPFDAGRTAGEGPAGRGAEPTGEDAAAGASPGGGGQAGTDLDALSIDELRGLAREARDLAQRNWQQFLHSAADLENYKKQAARSRDEAVERTRRQMLSLVLGVIDNLERALAFGEAKDGPAKALVDGLRIAHRQALDQLRAIGVRPIEAAGAPFDPRLHEAVAVVPPAASGQRVGMVAAEVLKGYLLNDEVLRPAKVTVVGEAGQSG